MKLENELYAQLLERYEYSKERIEGIIKFRDKADHCTFEQFKHLVSVGVVTRTSKLRKPRNLYVSDGKFWYLNHYHKDWNYCGIFTDLL